MHHIWRSTQIQGQTINQNLPKNYSKSTKIAIIKFFSGRACPRTPWSFSCFTISFKFVLPKENTLETFWEIIPPPLFFKFLATPLIPTTTRQAISSQVVTRVLHYTEAAMDRKLCCYYYITMDELLNPETDERIV